jgi:hypothetical protein
MWFWMNSRWTAGVMLSAVFFGGAVFMLSPLVLCPRFRNLPLPLSLRLPQFTRGRRRRKRKLLNQYTSTATAS